MLREIGLTKPKLISFYYGWDWREYSKKLKTKLKHATWHPDSEEELEEEDISSAADSSFDSGYLSLDSSFEDSGFFI